MVKLAYIDIGTKSVHGTDLRVYDVNLDGKDDLVFISLFILSQNQNEKVRQVRAVAFGTFATVTSVVSDIINISSYKKSWGSGYVSRL